MRHYEIVFLVHPDQSEQVPAMIDRYKGMFLLTFQGQYTRFANYVSDSYAEGVLR